MDIERKIALRARYPARRYRRYSRVFHALLAVADILTYLYFYGVPFFPNLLPHLTSMQPVVDFFVRGLERGMR